MSVKWKLDSIYDSTDGEKFLRDIELYSQKTDEINAFAEKNFMTDKADPQAAEKYISLKEELVLFDSLSAYINFILSTDSENAEAAKLFDRISEISVRQSKAESLFRAYLKNADLSEFKKNPVTNEHIYFLEKEKEEARYSLSAESEEVMAAMKTTGSSSWQKLWESLTSSLSCGYEGKNLTLWEIRGMAYSPDSDVRKKAYESELNAYEKIASAGAFCLNSIKGEVINEVKLRGADSPLHESLRASGMNMDILTAMISAIDESVDELNGFYRKKAKYLGKETLPFYDLFAPVGNEELKFSFNEARTHVENIFSGFSPKMGAFAKRAFENSWIDAEIRKGKVGGAYCEYIKKTEESRILMNFSGNFEDIITLSHELGHGYHNLVFGGETPINADTPMPLAETASTFCENLAYKAAESFLPENALVTVKESRLSGELQSILDIYSRFLFEDSFFREREKGSLRAGEICELMTKAQLRAYKGGLDPKALHPFMWLCKPHYYDAGFNYYNYPYAFGDIFARSLFGLYEKMGADFIPLYDKILSSCGKMSVKDVGLIVGADFTDVSFWKDGISRIIKDINNLSL